MTPEQRTKIEAKINDIELAASEYAVGYHSVAILLNVAQELFDEIDALTRERDLADQGRLHWFDVATSNKSEAASLAAENARLAAELAEAKSLSLEFAERTYNSLRERIDTLAAENGELTSLLTGVGWTKEEAKNVLNKCDSLAAEKATLREALVFAKAKLEILLSTHLCVDHGAGDCGDVDGARESLKRAERVLAETVPPAQNPEKHNCGGVLAPAKVSGYLYCTRCGKGSIPTPGW